MNTNPATVRLHDQTCTVADAVARVVRELSRGNAGAAGAVCDLILREIPDHAEVHNYRGIALQQLRRVAEALVSYDRALALQPAYADAQLNRGTALLALRRPGDALTAFDRLLVLRPDAADAHNSRGIALQEMKRYDEALASLDRAIALQPGHALAHSNRGLVLRQLKRFDQALAGFDRAVALQPDNAKNHNNRALALQDLKRYGEALAAFDRAVALQPGYAVAHNNRGLVLQAMGQPTAAVASFDRALALQPGYAAAHNNRGVALIEAEREAEALVSFDQAIALQPDNALAYNNRGVALNRLEHYAEALASLDKAIALQPDYARSHDSRGRALKGLRRFAEALESCDRAVALDPEYAEAHNTRGTVLLEMGLYEDALASCDKAIAIDPAFAEAYENRGAIRAAKGDLREAESMFRKSLALKPDLLAALYQLVAIRKYHDADHEDVRALRTLLDERGLSGRNRQFILFALGKVYDDCGRYDDAFECYRRANDICNAKVSYDPKNVATFFDGIIELFSKDFVARPFSFASDSRSPLFVVGMPRSGTTLVTSILSNHPCIGSAGELTTFGEGTATMSKLTERDIPYPESIRHITPAAGVHLTSDYEKSLRRDVGPDVPHVIDKNPLNFHYLGLIRMLFPMARIIHCIRNPLDTGLSNYFQYFALAHAYSFDLRNIGHFYSQYVRLMAHWRSVLPVPMIEVQYEDLIQDTERVVRATLESLGLEWNDRCLAPHTNPNAVRTASHWQVRQPIYDRSAGRWRHYEQHLGPLKEALGPILADSVPSPVDGTRGDNGGASG
jgi:tetratricopeptide (TPR) repeat protein